MIEYLKPAAIIGSIMYSVIGLILVIVAFVVVDRITPYDLWKELIENRNQPLATVVAAFCLSIAIIVAAAIHG
jgi:putative membrane protein